MRLNLNWDDDADGYWTLYLELVPESPDEELSVRAIVREAPDVVAVDGFSLGAFQVPLKRE